MSDIVEIKQDKAGEWRWHRKDGGNNEILSQGEGYKTPHGAIIGALRANPDLSADDLKVADE